MRVRVCVCVPFVCRAIAALHRRQVALDRWTSRIARHVSARAVVPPVRSHDPCALVALCAPRSAEIEDDDVERAISKLQVLGSGFQIIQARPPPNRN